VPVSLPVALLEWPQQIISQRLAGLVAPRASEG